MPATTKTVYIQAIVINENDKALLLRCRLEQGDEPVSGEVWFPRSQIELIGPMYALEAERNPGFAEVLRLTDPALCMFSLPEWLARKSGVCYGTRR